jgi:hypothetical protein
MTITNLEPPSNNLQPSLTTPFLAVESHTILSTANNLNNYSLFILHYSFLNDPQSSTLNIFGSQRTFLPKGRALNWLCIGFELALFFLTSHLLILAYQSINKTLTAIFQMLRLALFSQTNPISAPRTNLYCCERPDMIPAAKEITFQPGQTTMKCQDSAKSIEGDLI